MSVVEIKDWLSRARTEAKDKPHNTFTPFDPAAKDTIGRGSRFDEDGCLIWQGEVHPKHGYPIMEIVDGLSLPVRYIAWQAFFGPLPDRGSFSNSCGKPRCVHINHIELPDNLLGSGEPPQLGRPKKVRNPRKGER